MKNANVQDCPILELHGIKYPFTLKKIFNVKVKKKRLFPHKNPKPVLMFCWENGLALIRLVQLKH